MAKETNTSPHQIVAEYPEANQRMIFDIAYKPEIGMIYEIHNRADEVAMDICVVVQVMHAKNRAETIFAAMPLNVDYIVAENMRIEPIAKPQVPVSSETKAPTKKPKKKKVVRK